MSEQERSEGRRMYLRLDDKTTWPDPSDPNEVQHRLRYGTPTRSDLLFAASVMHAYAYLGLGAGNKQLPLLRRTARAAAAASLGLPGRNEKP